MTELYREPTEREKRDFISYGTPGIRERWTVPVELCEHGKVDEHIWGNDGFNADGVFEPVTPCNGAGLGDQYRDPHGWGDHPPIESTDL